MNMKIHLYTDGGSRGNPGPAAVGAVVKQNDQVIKKYGETIGEATNNEAEYQAVLFGLKKVKLLYGKKEVKKIQVEVMLDSELVAKQLNHEYKIKEETLVPLFIELWNLIIDFKKLTLLTFQERTIKRLMPC